MDGGSEKEVYSGTGFLGHGFPVKKVDQGGWSYERREEGDGCGVRGNGGRP
jgi:hypothetical protein